MNIIKQEIILTKLKNIKAVISQTVGTVKFSSVLIWIFKFRFVSINCNNSVHESKLELSRSKLQSK